MSWLTNGPQQAPLKILLAHGAGAPMDSEFMNSMAEGLGQLGWSVLRFEFPYMVERRQIGKKRPPNRQPVLEEAFEKVIQDVGDPNHLVIGGKSMGGRMASLIADRMKVRGLIALGFPFHPPGKPMGERVAHLKTLKTPTLIVQGERDPFGNKEELAAHTWSPQVHVSYLADGDHSFKPRKSSGLSERDNWSQAITLMDEFLKSLC